MTKECSWGKDLLGHWQFHLGRTSRRDIVRSWFNWRPSQFNLGFNISISPSGLNLEIALWFHWNFSILFFVPEPRISEKNDYDDLTDLGE